MRAWEPQPGETKKAWDAFKIYRDLGDERSLQKVSQLYYGSTASVRQIGRWSSKYEWVERCQAFDAHLEMIENDAIEKYVRVHATEFVERQAALREKRLAYAEKIASQIDEMVEWPLARRVTQEDGETVHVIPTRWSKTTIAHLDQIVAGAVEPGDKTEGSTPEYEKLMELLEDPG